ncbi:MAG: hypothetical protein ACREGB_01420 [Candidatus Saccharimonadales bacterium]
MATKKKARKTKKKVVRKATKVVKKKRGPIDQEARGFAKLLRGFRHTVKVFGKPKVVAVGTRSAEKDFIQDAVPYASKTLERTQQAEAHKEFYERQDGGELGSGGSGGVSPHPAPFKLDPVIEEYLASMIAQLEGRNAGGGVGIRVNGKPVLKTFNSKAEFDVIVADIRSGKIELAV